MSKRGKYRVDWYRRNGCIVQQWEYTLREARLTAARHRDAEIFKEG